MPVLCCLQQATISIAPMPLGGLGVLHALSKLRILLLEISTVFLSFMRFLCNLLFKRTMQTACALTLVQTCANIRRHWLILTQRISKEHLAGLGKDILADNSALRALHWPE